MIRTLRALRMCGNARAWALGMWGESVPVLVRMHMRMCMRVCMRMCQRIRSHECACTYKCTNPKCVCIRCIPLPTCGIRRICVRIRIRIRIRIRMHTRICIPGMYVYMDSVSVACALPCCVHAAMCLLGALEGDDTNERTVYSNAQLRRVSHTSHTSHR